MKAMIHNIKWNKGILFLFFLVFMFSVMTADLNIPAAAAGDGISEYYVLFIVTSNEDLNGSPLHDAQAVTSALKNIKTAAGRTISRENILILQEPDVTTNNLSSVITQYFSKMDEDDVGMFFYSGHGINGAQKGFHESYMMFKNDKGYYAPYSVSELASTLNALPGTFFVDLACCFSGGFIGKGKQTTIPMVEELSALFSGNTARAFTKTVSNDLYHRDKFFVITEASALQEGFSEGGSLNMDISLRAFTGALGMNTQSFYESGTWKGENQPMGNFAADVNEDRKLSFNEITRWMKDNTVTNSVQCYPERSDAVLFTYDEDDPRREVQVNEITVNNQICLPGETVSMELTCSDDNQPTVFYICMDSVIGTTLYYGFPDVSYLGNGRYKYRVTASADWVDTVSYFEIYHPVQGIMARLFTVMPQAKAPAAELKVFDPQPAEIIPLQGMEYRITLTFDVACWFDVQIADQNGKIVRTLAQKDMSVVKGTMETYRKTNSYYWDGTDDIGNPVPDGAYLIQARAYNAWGEQMVTGITAPVNNRSVYVDSTTVIMRHGSSYSIVNDEVVRTTVNHGVYTTIQLVGNKTLAPVRYVSEVMGLRVDWDETTYKTAVTNTQTGESLVFSLDDRQLSKYDIDGNLIATAIMEIPPTLIDGSTYIPLRLFAECLNFQVEYCEYTDGNAYIIVTDRKPAYGADEIMNLCGQVSGKI